MGDRKKKDSRFGIRKRFGPASGSGGQNLVKDPPGSLASGQSVSDPQLGQSSGEQESQQAALSPPNTSRTGRFWDKWGWRSASPSPAPGHRVERRNNSPDQPIATASLAVPAGVLARPHSSHSDSSTLQTHRLSVNIITVPSGSHGSPPSGIEGSTIPVSAPIDIVQISHSQSESIASGNPAPPSTISPHIPTSTSQAQASAEVDIPAAVLPQTDVPDSDATEHSPQVWAKVLEIAKKKLSGNSLPPLDLTNLTSQSAEENIEAVVKALTTAQKDDKKKRWSYTWRGKEVIFVEHLGKILKSVEKYTKVVGAAISSNPQVSGLVWAGILAIMRVRMMYSL